MRSARIFNPGYDAISTAGNTGGSKPFGGVSTEMDYFYVQQGDVEQTTLVVRGDEAKHLARVLRKTAGERIFVTDGADTMYEAVISRIGKNEVRCDISAVHRRFQEPCADVTLAVSMLRNPARFDYLIEKTTELGVRAVIPLQCRRTIVRKEKRERLEKIALSAVKQCGRSWIPKIQPVQEFESLIVGSSRWPVKLVLHEKTDLLRTIPREIEASRESGNILLVIGPEGGLTDDEVAGALDAGFRTVSLGARRLRTETAAVVAVALAVDRAEKSLPAFGSVNS